MQQRMASYFVAMAVMKERPLLGTGIGTSGFYMERYWPQSFIRLPEERVSAATMMSHYATVGTETGLLGLLCVAGFGVGVLLRLRAFGRLGNGNEVLAWGIGASIAGYCITAVATSLVVYQIMLVWVLPAIALSLAAPIEERQPRAVPS